VLLDTGKMADENTEAPSVTDIVSFCLEDSDTSDVDGKFVSLTTAQQQFVGAEGGDDISLTSNGHDSSSYDSLVDNEEISPG